MGCIALQGPTLASLVVEVAENPRNTRISKYQDIRISKYQNIQISKYQHIKNAELLLAEHCSWLVPLHWCNVLKMQILTRKRIFNNDTGYEMILWNRFKRPFEVRSRSPASPNPPCPLQWPALQLSQSHFHIVTDKRPKTNKHCPSGCIFIGVCVLNA